MCTILTKTTYFRIKITYKVISKEKNRSEYVGEKVILI